MKKESEKSLLAYCTIGHKPDKSWYIGFVLLEGAFIGDFKAEEAGLGRIYCNFKYAVLRI